jgi:hypothetical protein
VWVSRSLEVPSTDSAQQCSVCSALLSFIDLTKSHCTSWRLLMGTSFPFVSRNCIHFAFRFINMCCNKKISIIYFFWSTNNAILQIKTLRFVPKFVCLFVVVLTAWTQGLHLEPLHQPFFCVGLFWDRVLRTICPYWLQTSILLTSASWVVRITGVSHWCLAVPKFIA